MKPTGNKGIKSWAEDDRPREKLLRKGNQALSNAELVAILLGSGNDQQSALELARDILNQAHNNVNELARMEVSALQQFRGVGPAKAVTLAAALELGRRRKEEDPAERPQVKGSKDAYNLMADVLPDLAHEEFWVAYLNQAHRLISRQNISKGGISGTVADARIIFGKALENKAVALIAYHNHPSRQTKASQADIDLTRKLVRAGELLDIKVLDHIIVAGADYFSFADEGLL